MKMKNSNPFNIYTSKVKRFNIPLPSFNYFHRASSEEKVDTKFIGRERISKRLYSWLTEEKTKSGSYLITGYRGMGKSSFVGRILYELSVQTTGRISILGYLAFFLIWGGCILSVTNLYFGNDNWLLYSGLICLFVGICIIYGTYYRYINLDRCRRLIFTFKVAKRFFLKKDYKTMCFMEKIKHSIALFKKDNKEWERINKEVYNTNIRGKSYKRLCININLGQEILHEKDVLSLLAHQLYLKYKSYIHSPISNFRHWLIQSGFSLATAIIISIILYNNIQIFTINGFVINEFLGDELSFLLICILCFVIIYAIYRRASSWLLYSQETKLKRLKYLKERIDAQIELEKKIDVGVLIKDGMDNWKTNINNGKKKYKKYPLAETRVIEQELIDILESISFSAWSPHFILVFDELDKIESEVKLPFNNLEYTNEKNFPGRGTSRTRKQNVLHLLANMKLFISTAKAKFIFIAGRELYDAYLADLSDREFAISSIFNGVIYVESFCSNERREKDIMSNAETFICKQLIPQKVIEEACIEHYTDAKILGANFDRLDVNLKMYYKYLVLSYLSFFSRKKDKNDSKVKDSKKNSENKDDKLKDIRDCIDKAIVLLYHFSVYLYHISNGSPKKMSLYFEKYVRSLNSDKQLTFRNMNQSVSILENQSIDIKINCKAKYCLSFGYMDQRVIGFIHYISFPVTQIIINANQFGDKLLLSASFLIDHIYKFHKGGFSWRNMEHTPELLEVYRIPEFRVFINSILSYLTQSHIIPITCGLYQFKFRKQISEEISLASKFSEEIAALFNFTLDESLSVKQHYIDLLEYYGQDKSNTNPHVMAGIHVILADLFMADEEYTKAIFEYQTGINIMKEEEKKNEIKKFDVNDQHTITRILFLIRNLLKLGLAFEKRKTYESAYVTYNELIGRLIDFRDIDENSLNLNYAIKTKRNEHEVVLYVSEHNGNPDQKKNSDFNNKYILYPEIKNKIDEKKENTLYSVNGPDIIVDFAHYMTPEKNHIIQRLAMQEDIRLMYQAILAKIFVLEKIELGGITRANIELLESEYVFLHLATNEKNKFLISNDFFRRLGDIMFYKNGLTKEFFQDSENSYNCDSFMDGMYLWSYNIRAEILDFCNENKCYDLKDKLISIIFSIRNEDVENGIAKNIDKKEFIKKYVDGVIPQDLSEKFITRIGDNLEIFPIKKILECNEHRKCMWNFNKHLPCFACKYYNKSLTLLMKNLFNSDLEKECKEKNCSKVFIILYYLIKDGSFKSLRQNFLMQLAEVLDCLGNVMLSCTSNVHKLKDKDKTYQCEITSDFLKTFLKDVYQYNRKDSTQSDLTEKISFLKYDSKDITMLEKVLLIYWESFICFRMGNDFKKASGSLKKILQTILEYMKLDETNENRKIIIGEFLNEIKNRILKQGLINLYEYYNYINIIEIQKLKWIFHVQMYESISLNRLSMFPDVEEFMLLYYDIMSYCITDKDNENNRDFKIRLTGIYKNIALGSLRLESTIYERVLSLQFKANMNMRILCILLKNYVPGQDINFYKVNFYKDMVIFIDRYIKDVESLNDKLGEYRYCFQEIINNKVDVRTALSLLEFLITDSMYCLTRILEIITPYTSTTLFNNTFLGDVYLMLYKWNVVFDVLYMTYRASEMGPINQVNKNVYEWKNGMYSECNYYNGECKYLEAVQRREQIVKVQDISEKKCPLYSLKCKYKTTQIENIASILTPELSYNLKKYRDEMHFDIAEVFFNSVLKGIGKSNIHYTLCNYSAEMALKFYRQALDMHHEGKSYKDMISTLYYLDDDLKNDTIQFDLALERMGINNEYIDKKIKDIMNIFNNASIYDVENFCADNETRLSLDQRFNH